MWNTALCSETCWLDGESEGVMPLWVSSGTNEVKGNFWGARLSLTPPYHKGDNCLDSGAWRIAGCSTIMSKNEHKCHCLVLHVSSITGESWSLPLQSTIKHCFVWIPAYLNTTFYMTLCFIIHGLIISSISFSKMLLEWFLRALLQHHCLCLHSCFWHSEHTTVIIIKSISFQ